MDELKGLNAVYQTLATIEWHEFSLQRFFRLVVETGARLTDAQYAALGVFDGDGTRLTDFFTVGIDEQTKTLIGAPPTGRGLLGAMAEGPGVLRLKDLSCHPSAVGFPPHHPKMTSFLGVSIRTHGKLFGRIYLTNKRGGGDFTVRDEEIIAALAAQAGLTIQTHLLITRLQAAEQEHRMLLDSVEEGIWRINAEGRCIFANRAALEILGYTAGAVLGADMHALVHHTRPDGASYSREECPVICSIRTGRGGRATNEVLWRRDGASVPVEYSFSPVVESGAVKGAVVIFRDISEQVKIEEQLRHTQKMSIVDSVAAGIAHDFNNILTVILGRVLVMSRREALPEQERQELQEIHKAAEYGSALTARLLSFCRKRVPVPQALNLSALVQGLEIMLRRLLGEQIALRLVLELEPGDVRADPGQLEQVLINLAVNARDAMPDGGALTIMTAQISPDQPVPGTTADIPPGSYMALTIADTGVGMDQGTRERLFEPFFTTKEPGKGTGLGLSIVQGIVKQNGGFIDVRSERGRGTTFTIYLPCLRSPAMPDSAARARKSIDTILVVEDEEILRTFIQTVLKEEGYHVLEARTADEAAQRYGEQLPRADVVIADADAQQMNGMGNARMSWAARLGSSILYISDFDADAIVQRDALAMGVAFLKKPFAPEDLLLKLSELSNARQTS